MARLHDFGGAVKKTMYELLEVSKNASKGTIDKAYQLMRKRYAELEKTDPTASEQLKFVTLAYEVISDPVQRDVYDNRIAQQNVPEGRSAATSLPNPTPSQIGNKSSPATDVEAAAKGSASSLLKNPVVLISAGVILATFTFFIFR